MAQKSMKNTFTSMIDSSESLDILQNKRFFFSFFEVFVVDWVVVMALVKSVSFHRIPYITCQLNETPSKA